MADDEESILQLIENTYVPFLKKLLSHLDKKKEVHPKRNNLKYVFDTFSEADAREKIKVFHATKDMLDKWHNCYKNRSKSGKKNTNDSGIHSEDSQPDSLSNTKIPADVTKQTPTARKKDNVGSMEGNVTIKDSIEIDSSNSAHSYTILPTPTDNNVKFPTLKIKQEKDIIHPTPATIAPSPQIPTNSAATTTSTPVPKPTKEITFVCASCQFSTTIESDFVKHARTDHRTDLSLWCKKCGRCFSNAGVLVSHIKEDNCEKEDMIYRCGVKECTFETPSGQTFVHHLRHCHKGSPFIYCVHCQKIFTLPHCLILHMQNDCPFKEKNRKNGAVASTPIPSKPAPAAAVVVAPKPPATPVTQPTKTVALPTAQSTVRLTPKPVMVKRSRGRGRSRVLRAMSDTSDSEDPDDPSWKPEESTNNQPLRRSARWAKKVSDAKDPEISDCETSSGKPKNIPEQPGKTFFYCPCCDFSALFKSLLLDHYITDHKEQKRKQCLVCRVKFESKQSFLDHFVIHEKEKADGKTPGSTNNENGSHETPENVEITPQITAITSNEVIKIPYQTAIQSKGQKDNKVKAFEDLKSDGDILKMKTETKLQHFFKCVVFNCSYTTDDSSFYQKHMNDHKAKKLHCLYCLDEFDNSQTLTDHMLKIHGRRFYQCGLCFYRALSKAHVQIHIRNVHAPEKCAVYKSSQHLPSNYEFNQEEDSTDLTTTWPYVCAVGDCSFQTYDPKEFKKHNDVVHRSVSVFICHYCKVDFISFKRLLNHYHLHGINNFQCVYCIHGSETKDEILLHLCTTHADKSFKVHVRTQDSGANKDSSNDMETKSTVEVNQDEHSSDSTLGEYTNHTLSFPVEVPSLEQEVFCHLGLCTERLEDLQSYLKHVIADHEALNYLCPYCHFASDSLTEFESHLMCHGPNLYMCTHTKCTIYFSSEVEVKKHMSSSHKLVDPKPKTVRESTIVLRLNLKNESLPEKATCTGSPLICPFCCFKCAEEKTMKNHVYQELLYRRFQCNLCKIRCFSRSDAIKHFKKFHFHHNIKCSADRNATIEYLVKYSTSTIVQKKIAQCIRIEDVSFDRPSGFPPSKCQICVQHHQSMREFHFHEASCISQGYKPFICDRCGEKVSCFLDMKCHTAEAHSGSSITFSSFPNKLLEEQNNRKLQESRTNFLQALVTSVLDANLLKNIELVPKHYKCSYCNFTDYFRCNIEKHCLGCHKDKKVSMEKITTEPTLLSKSVDSSADESSQDACVAMDIHNTDYFLCVYCTNKIAALGDLDNHVEVCHSAVRPENNIYAYFYRPNPEATYSPNDTELYECAYCSVSQENLFHLKQHTDNVHSGMTFQVRGHKMKDDSIIICKYCDCEVVTRDLLSKHTSFNHPGKPIKAANDACGKQGIKRKANEESVSSKRPKIAIEVYECSHCFLKINTLAEFTSHTESVHPELPVRFNKVPKEIESLNSNNGGALLLHCDFCTFIGEKKLLARHVQQKHQSCVSCGHCNKNLESPEILAIHTTTEHPQLEVKEVNFFTQNFGDSNIPEVQQKESMDFMDVTVNIRDQKTSVDAKLPLMHLAKVVPIFPKVVLKDISKK